MKRIEKNRENFLKYGLSDEVTEKLINNSYTVSKIRPASIKDLSNFLSEEEAKDVKNKIARQPIADDVFERLVKETELHCCFCWDIKKEQPIIIHHIEEYNQTQDNNYNNLIVLCLNHHGEIHTKRQISQQNFPKIRQLDQKEKWIEALRDYRAGKRSAPGSETKDDNINVVNSPGAIVTKNQTGNNVIVNQHVSPQRKVVYFQGDTKPTIDSNTGNTKTLYVFGSEYGIALSDISVSIRFDKTFLSATGYVGGNGMVVAGNLDRQVHSDNKGFDFETNILNPNNYLVIEIESNSELTITDLKTKP